MQGFARRRDFPAMHPYTLLCILPCNHPGSQVPSLEVPFRCGEQEAYYLFPS